ncbi:MAG: helix-turn-helix domain-containing protein [Parvibaculum sp.]|uniref:helix-turn-helix domain-containing protein n=1 Tax=Parvibaculum sp. TaxID=2024848 RepID=UPI003267B925
MTGHKEEIGSMLRAARQAAGLSLQQIAGEIRIRPIYLQAIEAGQFELLPALPQTVGFTRAYAKHLHVDVEAPLSRLGEEVHRDIESRVYSEPEPLWTVSPRRVGYVGIGAVAAVVLLALAVIDFGTEPSQIASAVGPEWGAAEEPVSSSPVASAQAGNTVVMKRVPARPASAPVTAALVSRPAASAPVAVGEAAYRPETVAAGASSSVDGLIAAVPAEEAMPAGAGESAGQADRRFVTGSVYFRAKPGNDGAEIGVLDACEPVVFLGTDATDYWREVRRADGTSGWVFRDYVAGDKPAACS